MFTGIVTHQGEVLAIEPFSGGLRLRIMAGMDAEGIALGASILHSGVCLTVTEIARAEGTNVALPAPRVDYVVEVSPETLARTTLGAWRVGGMINLERALQAGDEFGGHFVTGHVDAIGRVCTRRMEGEWTILVFEAPASLARFIAGKGSIAVDGVSLTVNSVEDRADSCAFSVTIIPHTAANTTLGALQPGDRVNFEIDLIARYVARASGFPV